MSNAAITYPKISGNPDSHDVKIKPIEANDNGDDNSDEELNELLKDGYKKLTIGNVLKTKHDEKILNFKCELIELMKKQLDTINLIISLK